LANCFKLIKKFQDSQNLTTIGVSNCYKKVCKFASIGKQEKSLDSFMNIFAYLLNMPHYEGSLIIQLGLFYLRRCSLKCIKFMCLKRWSGKSCNRNQNWLKSNLGSMLLHTTNVNEMMKNMKSK